MLSYEPVLSHYYARFLKHQFASNALSSYARTQ